MKKSDLEFLWNIRTKGLSEETKSRLLKPTGKNNSLVNRDYIYALAIVVGFQRSNPEFEFTESTTAQDIWLGIPQTERFRLSFYTPCLALNFDELKETEQKEILDKPDWYFTRKYTGIRCILVYINGTTKLYSRNFSDDDCHCLEYFSKIYQQPNTINTTYVVDVEMVLSKQINITDDLNKHNVYPTNDIESLIGLIGLEISDSLYIQKQVKEQFGTDLIEFRLIAPIYYNGVNYLKKTLGEGMDVYNRCAEYGYNTLGLNVKPIGRCNGGRYEKTVFLNTILNEGGEGVVAQNYNGTYCTSDKRSKESYIKIKHQLGERKGLADTIDGYIGGFKVGDDGIINALQVFVQAEFNGKYNPHLIATVPIGVKLGKELTIDGFDGHAPVNVGETDKVVSLNYNYYHKVVEIDGNGINAGRKVITPKFVRFRDDKSMSECVYSADFILSQIKEKNNYIKV